jgi:PAS domain S-box-containing protein
LGLGWSFLSERVGRVTTLVAVAVLLSLVGLIYLGQAHFADYRQGLLVRTMSYQIGLLKGTIIHLDEVLSMSARMAAATGDPGWEQRYRDTVPALTAAIQEARDLAADLYNDSAAAQTDAANTELVMMEERAFDFVRRGDMNAANQVLTSEEYRRQKTIYVNGMSRLEKDLAGLREREREEWQRDHAGALAGAITLITVLVLSWLFVARELRRSQAALAARNKELLDLNGSLDKTIAARTRELAKRKKMLEKSVARLAREIDRRREADEDVRQLLAAVEQVDQMMLITDADGVIQYVNQAFERTTGYARREAVGQRPSLLSSGQHDGAFYHELWETIKRGDTWTGHFTNMRKDGTLFKAASTVCPIRDMLGRVCNFVQVARDVTDQAALERQLEEARKLESIGRLAHGIAHEINTPMQFVGDNLRFLQDGFARIEAFLRQREAAVAAAADDLARGTSSTSDETDVKDLLSEVPSAIKDCLDGVERVSRIVRAMNEFAHGTDETKRRCDLNRVVENAIEVARHRWRFVAKIVTDFAQELPLVMCVPGALNQVFLNLIVNAAQAVASVVGNGSERKGVITVSTRQLQDAVEVRVRDTGTGIPPDIARHIFDPFFTTKDVGEGTGQGLALAHNIVVHRCKGRIWYEPTGDGGATFVVRLPLDEESNIESAASTERSASVLGLRGCAVQRSGLIGQERLGGDHMERASRAQENEHGT